VFNMGMNVNDVVEVFRDVFSLFRDDYILSRSDPLIRVRGEVFQKIYAVKPLVSKTTNIPFLFVDAGFKQYQLDVAIFEVVQIGGLIRDENGKLHDLREYLDIQPVESLLVYSSRVRSGDEYSFRVELRSFTDRSIICGSRLCRDVNTGLGDALKDVVSYGGRTRNPRFFAKLAGYIEGLLELAYGLIVRKMLKDSVGLNPVLVIDGSLIRWFSIRRSRASVDGLDILGVLTRIDKNTLHNELYSIIGLAKSTKFTTIAQS